MKDLPDSFPADISGTYLAAIPERAIIDLIREMVNKVHFRCYDCRGGRRNLSNGWVDRAKLRYNYQCTRAGTTFSYRCSARIRCSSDTDVLSHYRMPGGPNLYYRIELKEWVVDLYFPLRYIIGVTINPEDRCIRYIFEERSDHNMNHARYTLDMIGPLLCPVDRNRCYPYHEPVTKLPFEYRDTTYECTLSRGADGRIEYVCIENDSSEYFWADAILAPYEPGAYNWSTSQHRGTITILDGAATSFTAETKVCPATSPIEPIAEEICAIILAFFMQKINQ